MLISPNNIAADIKVADIESKTAIGKWQSLEPLLKRNIQGVTDISVATADKYRGDFYGLLTELEIPKNYQYPHVLVNNMDASTDYTGINTKIKIIKLSLLQDYAAWIYIVDN